MKRSYRKPDFEFIRMLSQGFKLIFPCCMGFHKIKKRNDTWSGMRRNHKEECTECFKKWY